MKSKLPKDYHAISIYNYSNSSGPIAQWIEHPPSKRVVAGSNPARSNLRNPMEQLEKKNSLLGDYEIPLFFFPLLDEVFNQFHNNDFLALDARKRFKEVNKALLKLIQNAPEQSFLLTAVIDFIERVNHAKVLNEPYTFSLFEFWLNQFSGLTEQENYRIRGKIAGKYLPRGEYQSIFPIGMDKVFAGTHFVAAHMSPDVDTTIASFWGWLDALSSRVGKGLHLWSLPGGPPDSTIIKIFSQLFGHSVFSCLARQAGTLTMNAMDLVTQQNFVKEVGSMLTNAIDHGANEKASVLIDDKGNYVGDWRASDVELVTPILFLAKSCLRWFENNLHVKLISFFAKKDLSVKDIPELIDSGFNLKLKNSEPVIDFTEKQRKDLHNFFFTVIGISNGLDGTFADLNIALSRHGISELLEVQKTIGQLASSGLFDARGLLEENRPKIFNYFEKIIKQLDNAILSVRQYLDRLDIAMSIKHNVLGQSPLYITLRSDVDEMRVKIKNYDYLTVVIQNHDGSLFPLGIVRAIDLRKSILGTVSLRDFCNQDEIKMASYLEVISVIDHHKSTLKTTSTPMALISDTQSCNILLAEQSMPINDRYSLSGMTNQEVEIQIRKLMPQAATTTNTRLMQKLLQKRITAQSSTDYYVHPVREFIEYLCYLHAILDDTDLLTKVSDRDVQCVATLLNKLKTLSAKQEIEIINLDNIPKDKNFAKTASKRILQHPDMYSLYKKVYLFKEQEVDENLKNCIEGRPSNIFVDTKEQNGCARVGQTKMFSSNFSFFSKHVEELRSIWYRQALEVYQKHPEIDFHLHMISTIASAEEVYADNIGNYTHEDEIWFWVPTTQQAYDHLSSFLSSFLVSLEMMKPKWDSSKMSAEFLGPHAAELLKTFKHNFASIKFTIPDHAESSLPLVILRFKAGFLNSRKSMITPNIPRLVS